jgi:hypothetical protein
MFPFFRPKPVAATRRPPVFVENLEQRRLLSADHIAAGLQLNVPRHPTTVATQQTNIDLGTVGPEVPPGSFIGLSVRWGRGKSTVRQDAYLTSNLDGTSELYTVSPPNLGAGVHTMRLTMSVDATVVATLSRQVRFLPHSANGLALQAVAGKPFSGPVGYLDRPLASDEVLSIAWGDGTADTVTSTQTTADNRNAVDGSHTYAQKGNYVISVTRSNVVPPGSARAVHIENVIVTTMHVRG